MARQPVVYIMASANGRAIYIGVTTDLQRRLEEHRRGLSIHSSKYNIIRLVRRPLTPLNARNSSRDGRGPK
jgi:predicted GIY-YIG superfamily endonuclease